MISFIGRHISDGTISELNNTGCRHNYSQGAVKFCGCGSRVGKQLFKTGNQSEVAFRISVCVSRQGSLTLKMKVCK